jgi:hypothetical protein
LARADVRGRLAALGAIVLLGISAPAGPLRIDDGAVADNGSIVDRFQFVGRWQHVTHKFDGRSNGTSTRSTRPGDVALFTFQGTRVRIYAVFGKSGGTALANLDGHAIAGRLDFYAPRTAPGRLVYESPRLPRGMHTLGLAVSLARRVRSHGYYVNIDGAEVDP